MQAAVSIIRRLQVFSIWGERGGLLSNSLLHMGTVTMHMCDYVPSPIMPLGFGTSKPLAIWRVTRGFTSSVSCGDGHSRVKSGNEVDVGACVPMTVPLGLILKSLYSVQRQTEITCLPEVGRGHECERGESPVQKTCWLSASNASPSGHTKTYYI